MLSSGESNKKCSSSRDLSRIYRSARPEIYRKHTVIIDFIKIDFFNVFVNNLSIFRFFIVNLWI